MIAQLISINFIVYEPVILVCYGTILVKKFSSAQPESNQRPRDINCEQLQSPALPTELYADLTLLLHVFIGHNPALEHFTRLDCCPTTWPSG